MSLRYRTDAVVEPGDLLVAYATGRVWLVVDVAEIRRRTPDPDGFAHAWRCTTERLPDDSALARAARRGFGHGDRTVHGFRRDPPRRRK